MLCEQISFIEVERCFNSPQEFLNSHQEIDFDVCLLDINMPDVNGIEIAQLLKGKQIIFTSAYPEFAVNAYEIEALDFIKKPVTKDRLEKALMKAQKNVKQNTHRNFFTWNTNLGKSTLYFNEILFITTSEIDKRDKVLHLINDNEIVLKNITIDKLLSLLPAKNFIQINKAEIISKEIIQAFTSDEIVLKLKGKNKSTLYIGDSFKKNFLSWIN